MSAPSVLPAPAPSWPRIERRALTPIPVHAGEAGALAVLESFDAVPFSVRRVFTITGVPEGGARGGHANAITQEFVVCLSGGVTVVARDALHQWEARLTSPEEGLYLPPMCWVELRDFAADTVLLVLADTRWADARGAYYRDLESWQGAIERTPTTTDDIVEL